MALDYLVDTNVLLRALGSADPQRTVARHALRSLLQSGADLRVLPRNLVEFWCVCNRPHAVNGLGKSVAITDRYCRYIEAFLTVLPETPAIFTEWRSLVVAHQVSGKNVHDARIVAAMRVYDVTRILTFDTDDFRRYAGIDALNPDRLPRLRITWRHDIPREGTKAMEVHFSPEVQTKLEQMARDTGRRSSELVENVVTDFFDELSFTRVTLDRRYDDLESGRATPIPSDEVFAQPRAKSAARHARQHQ